MSPIGPGFIEYSFSEEGGKAEQKIKDKKKECFKAIGSLLDQ